MSTFTVKYIFLFSILNTLSIYGQGIIKGLVTDSLTRDPLKGAEIILSGTNFNAVSNMDCGYNITGIPAGNYFLKSSYLGYKEKKILVSIKSNETQILNIELLPDIATGNEVSLTGQEMSQFEEINLQLNSNNIRNVISGRKLQNMPDENILIALNRLPGVSIIYRSLLFPLPDRSSWELNVSEDNVGILFPPLDNFPISEDPIPRVLIRGLASKYSNITIDGIKFPSTSAKDNSVDLSNISEKSFQNVELQKTITSDEDADATAGSINIFTGKAPNKRIIKAELAGNYNRFEKSADQYNFRGNYSDRFFNNLLGICVDVNVEKNILSSEYQNTPKSFLPYSNISYVNARRERKGANLSFDFITSDCSSVKLNFIYNKNNYDYFNSVADYTLRTTPKYIYCNEETERRLVISSIEGNNYLFGFDVDWNAAFSEFKNDYPFNFSLTFFGPPISSQLDNEFYLSNSINSPSKNHSNEKTVSIDFLKKYNLSNEITGEIKFGGKYSANLKFYDEDLRVENASLLRNNQYIKLADGSIVKKDFSGTRFDGLVGKSKKDILLSYFQDDPPGKRILFDEFVIPLISKDALRLWRQLNYNEYYSNDGLDINSYNFSGKVFAGYAMHYLNFGNSAKFITGFRIENEHNNYSGYIFPNVLTDAADLYNGVPQQTNLYYYNKVSILPDFQMILKPSSFLNLRLAAYKTLIRPDYNARIPKFFSASHNGIFYISMGNPDLKNADVWNYEFQTQFYGNDVGQFSINAFYKDIKGMQQAISGNNMLGVSYLESLGINWSSFQVNFPFDNNSGYSLYTYFNSPKPTHIWGFEIEHMANFRFLPGLFKNFVLNYNLTFLRSEEWKFDLNRIGSTTETLLVGKKQKMDNILEFFANVVLGYDMNGFSFRISYFYQGANPITRDYYKLQIVKNNLSRLDISVKQHVLKNISVILNLNNITNSKEEFSFSSDSGNTWQTAQAYRYGFNFDFGIGVDL